MCHRARRFPGRLPRSGRRVGDRQKQRRSAASAGSSWPACRQPALDSPGEASDPGSDALWVLLTALASAPARGYAHVVAHRMSADRGGAGVGLRAMLAEWPVVAAAVPTVVLLLTAVPSWWTEAEAVDTALALNALLLAGWGVWSARGVGRGSAASLRAGTGDMLVGLMVIVANALIE
ncbi:hypothetical protein ACVW19_005516 [Streptomyces sp. TE5632]